MDNEDIKTVKLGRWYTMGQLTMLQKGKLLVKVMESDLSPEQKAKELEFFKDDYEMESFLKMTFHDIYIAVLDHLGIEEYKGEKFLIKRLSTMF